MAFMRINEVAMSRSVCPVAIAPRVAGNDATTGVPGTATAATSGEHE
jgi:hypothetical protein